jgi:hypothetical protein
MSRRRRALSSASRLPQPGPQPASDGSLHSSAVVLPPLASAAALDSSAFAKVAATDAIPKTWEERARRAWDYYVEEPLVKNCVNSWRTFAVGDEIRLAADEEDFQAEVEAFSDRVDLVTFVKDMVLQLLVKGDAVGFKRYTKDGRDLEEVVCVNPISVKVKYAEGELVEVTQAKDETPGAEPLELPVEQVLHLKWDAPAFSPRGNSLVLPAFASIELLRDYRRAEQAIAKRWATPFRLLKVGGAYGPKIVMPDQRMLEQVRDMVNKMDLKSGLVVPFYVSVETHGTDGQVLNVEDKVKEVKEDIVVALGLSRSLVTGDGPNFATASISLQKMLVMIREIKHAARRILDWVLDDWRRLRGHETKTLQYLFNDLDPSDAVDVKRLLIELYDRKLISRSSLQIKMDLDPDVETANRENERRSVDLFDEKQVKPIVDLVTATVLPVEAAQELLGIESKSPVEQGPSPEAALAGRADLAGELCDGCSHFDEAENVCRVLREERAFDAAACRFFEARFPVGAALRKAPAAATSPAAPDSGAKPGCPGCKK